METTKEALDIIKKEFGIDNITILNNTSYCLSVNIEYNYSKYILTYNPYDGECYVTPYIVSTDYFFHMLKDAINFIKLN